MTLDELIEKQYNEALSRVFQVYEIFKDFFGESYVDVQDIPELEVIKKAVKSRRVYNCIDTNRVDTHYSRHKIEEVPEKECVDLLSRAKLVAPVLEETFSILVWFPVVQVTNENDRSTTVEDLYAKVIVEIDGTLYGKFTLNRATYTEEHMYSNYMHSHVSDIPRNDFSEFQNPCTGDGPINSTICSLQRDFDESLWELFCLELSKYVRVESIAGTPYHYLERLGTDNLTILPNTYPIILQFPGVWHGIYGSTKAKVEGFKSFLMYVLSSNQLKYGYIDGAYTLGLPYIKVVCILSNLFIEWYNREFVASMKPNSNSMISYERLLEKGILRKCKISNNHIYQNLGSSRRHNLEEYIGCKVCTFKGKEITINIKGFKEENTHESLILHHNIIASVVERILIILNYKYGKEDRKQETRGGDTPCEGVRFL